MKKKSFLIDCSSLMTGGGIQVALSFLTDLVIKKKSNYFNLYLSEPLMVIIKEQNSSLLESYKSVYVRKTPHYISVIINIFWYKNFDIVFCLFGPAYFLVKPKYLVSGFARPAIIYPDILDNIGIRKHFQKIKNWIHKVLFLRSDHLIVETFFVKSKLLRFSNYIKDENISVVHNYMSSDFVKGVNKNCGLLSKGIEKEKEIKLLFVGANYKHKNLYILASVFEKLFTDYGFEIKLFVTMNKIDFERLSDKLKKFSLNLGYIPPYRLKSVMKSADALIFPSLLECFSITPIEAMYCNLPIISSDREFIREFCLDVPFYFEPTQEISIVKAILEFINYGNKLQEKLQKGFKLASKYKNSMNRTNKYLKIIEAN